MVTKVPSILTVQGVGMMITDEEARLPTLEELAPGLYDLLHGVLPSPNELVNRDVNFSSRCCRVEVGGEADGCDGEWGEKT